MSGISACKLHRQHEASTGLLTVQPVIWKELPLREIITVYVATQMHILPGGKCIE